jgi:hypothetical protein
MSNLDGRLRHLERQTAGPYTLDPETAARIDERVREWSDGREQFIQAFESFISAALGAVPAEELPGILERSGWLEGDRC